MDVNGGFHELDVPSNGLFIMNTPMKIDDLGVPPWMQNLHMTRCSPSDKNTSHFVSWGNSTGNSGNCHGLLLPRPNNPCETQGCTAQIVYCCISVRDNNIQSYTRMQQVKHKNISTRFLHTVIAAIRRDIAWYVQNIPVWI